MADIEPTAEAFVSPEASFSFSFGGSPTPVDERIIQEGRFQGQTIGEMQRILASEAAEDRAGGDPPGTAALRAVTAEIAGVGITVTLPHVGELLDDLGGAVDFVLPHTLSVEGLLEKLSGLLLEPPRVPGEPCLAPTPLLRDLLDVALGRIRGGIGETIAKVGKSVLDLLTPAAATGADLAHFIQSILADPVTAALNLVLGMQGQIDCEVTARKDVGESVIEAGFKRLVGVIEEALA